MESKTVDPGEFFDKALDEEDKNKIIEADKRMTECFRRVFSTPDGKIVLHQLLEDLRFYDECVTETDTALNNFAKFMIFKRLKVNNKKQITKLIMELEGD